MMDRYYLMHNDDKVAIFLFDGNRLIEAKILDSILAPPGTSSESALISWWNNRAVPSSRLSYLKELIPSFNDSKEYLIANLGLSMNDHYWIKNEESELRWAEVSPFCNDFGIGRLDSKEGKSTQNFSPNASLQGQMDKKWICQNSDRILLKRYPENPFSTINEVFISELYSKLEFSNFVQYKFAKDRKGFIYCSCKAFTNEEVEFIPAISMCKGLKINYNDFIKFSIEQTGLEKETICSFLDIQTMMDFLITNRDRHLNNFGFLRNSKTLEYIGMAPIFDNDRSMLESDNFLELPAFPTIASILKIKANTFNSTERDNLKRIATNRRKLIDITKLPEREQILDFYIKHLNIRDKEFFANHIADLFCKKRMLLAEWQQGNSLGHFLIKSHD